MFRESILSIGALSFLALAACSSNSGGSLGVIGDGADRHAVTSTSGATYSPGTEAAKYDVDTFQVFASTTSADGTAAQAPMAMTPDALAPIYQQYPALQMDTNDLSSVTRAVSTTDSKVELYADHDLVLVLAVADGSATVVWARDGFSADSISITPMAGTVDTTATGGTVQDQDQDKIGVEVLTFDLKACQVLEQKQEQIQGKGDQDQGKMTDQTQGKLSDQSQDKDKQQEQIQSKEPTCQILAESINLNQKVQKQEQKQEQVQDKKQEQVQDKKDQNPDVTQIKK